MGSLALSAKFLTFFFLLLSPRHSLALALSTKPLQFASFSQPTMHHRTSIFDITRYDEKGFAKFGLHIISKARVSIFHER